MSATQTPTQPLPVATILIVEDDPALLKGLKAILDSEGYRVLTAMGGLAGYDLARREVLDLLILDRMLPGKNGLEICRDLRSEGVAVFILMLTSKGSESERIEGLETGADDYMTKPFSIPELQARIKALLRRKVNVVPNPASVMTHAKFGEIKIDFEKQEVRHSGKLIKLSSKELEILKFFVEHEGKVITREMLLNEIWGYTVFPTTRTVDNYILSLRKKLEDDPADPKHFLTAYTSGYKFIK